MSLRIVSAVFSALLAEAALGAGAEVITDGIGDRPGEARLVRLADRVAAGSSAERLDFALIALFEMESEYEAELGVASRERAKDHESQRKLWRWTAAARAYLEDLARSRRLVEDAVDVDVYPGAGGTAQIVADGRSILVSSVNLDTPELLGERIITAYCERHDCEFLETLEPRERRFNVAESTSGRSGRPGWSFGDGSMAVFEAGDGLGFMFADVKERALKERVCLALADELRLLGQRLDEASRSGYPIDWGSLSIDTSAEPQRVILNRKQAFLRMSLPALARAPSVLRMAAPWLTARMSGRVHIQLFPRAELLLKSLLSQPQPESS